MKTCTTVVFLMLTFAVAFSQKRGDKSAIDNKKEAQTQISLGDSYLQKGNGGMAVASYERAASLDPQNPLPHYKIGQVYVRSRNSEVAIESFRKAISVDSSYADAYKELGELYYAAKKGTEAVNAQQRYMDLKGNPDEGLVRLGYYLFMTRDFAKTNEVFAKAYEKNLLNDTGLRYYGLSLMENGDYENGRKLFEAYLSKVAGEASDYAAYGRALLELKQDSLAVISLERSLSIDNKPAAVKKMLWEALYNQGKSYYAKQQYALADTSFEKLIALHPGMVTGYLWAGRSTAQLDPESEKGLAKDFYQKVIEIGQSTPDKSKNDLKEAYSYLGYYYFVKKDVAESRANWQKVLTIDPQDTRAKEALKAIR